MEAPKFSVENMVYFDSLGTVCEFDLDEEMTSYIEESAERIYETIPDAIEPDTLPSHLRAKNAALIFLETFDAKHIGAIAVMAKRVSTAGEKYLALNVDVCGQLNAAPQFFAFIEHEAWMAKCGKVCILANGPFPCLPGYSVVDDEYGGRVLAKAIERAPTAH